MPLGTTTSAGDIYTAANWSTGALPSRLNPLLLNPQNITINKAMTNAVTSAAIYLNGFTTITSAGSVDCHGANLTIEDDCSIGGNITTCGTLGVQPSNSGSTSTFAISAGVTIGATTVTVQPAAIATAFLNTGGVALPAVTILAHLTNKVSLTSNLACASLDVEGILSGQASGSTAAESVNVAGALTVNGTLTLCTSITFGSCTNTGTISNSTVTFGGKPITNMGGTLSGNTFMDSGTILGGTVTGCTGTIQCFGATNGGGNSAGVLFAAELATFLNAEIAA